MGEKSKQMGRTYRFSILGSKLIALFALAFSLPCLATQITFTGGTAYIDGGTTAVTNSELNLGGVDYYQEGGFNIDFVGDTGHIGTYYPGGPDVIHAHWATGGGSSLTQIYVSKIDGTTFDLNYFVLTSNTVTGGGAANGTEEVYIHASLDGVNSSFSMLLPSEDWGFPATSIFLGTQFDGIKAFWFEAQSPVYCFGMDSFFIDEAAPEPDPNAVPEPSTMALFGLGVLGIFAGSRLRKNKSAETIA